MQVGNLWLQGTPHAGSREAAQYRDTALETLLDYGRVAHQRGGTRTVYLDRPAGRRLQRELGDDLLKRLEKRQSTYAVLARDGAVVTIGIASGASAGIPDPP